MTNSSSKRDRIIFWIATGLFSAFMLSSAIPNIMSTPEWVDIFKMLGYPPYMLPFIGVAKLLGVIAILVPGFPRIKEWAYAGLFFDLAGAVYSGLSVGGFDPQMLVMLVPFGLGTLSYVYHHKLTAK
ncbi:DoxX family protein [Imperialibacter roseus]|uniref:DoxX family protein n=1 Tax=Imperialibacter roseus TaxID=1324217 RepID=A0ABZ0IIS5_9BACT|nr:DoxX family protein [Imperialibacter roseus]WOK04935.1 DoxX family protein [Imperialibacter roseus]